jgi:hypothetical protein
LAKLQVRVGKIARLYMKMKKKKTSVKPTTSRAIIIPIIPIIITIVHYYD